MAKQSASAFPVPKHWLPPSEEPNIIDGYFHAAAQLELSPLDWHVLRELHKISKSTLNSEAHVLLLALIANLSEGSVCLRLDENAVGRSTIRLEWLKTCFGIKTDSIAFDRETVLNSFPKRLLQSVSLAEASTAGLHGPIVLLESQEPDRSIKALFFEKHLRQNLRLREQLTRVAKTPVEKALKQTRAVLQQKKEIGERVLSEYQDSLNIVLSAEQKLAFWLALSRPFLMIAGGPGSGKTTLTGLMLKAYLQLNVFASAGFALTAPTGRAVSRLEEAVQLNVAGEEQASLSKSKKQQVVVETLHRLLRYSPATGRFRYNEENPLPYSVIILDEVSMVDLSLMTHFFAALAPGTQVIIMGDPEQLPSVEAGDVFYHLLDVDKDTALAPEINSQIEELGQGALLYEANLYQNVLVQLKSSFRAQGLIQEVASQIQAYSSENRQPLKELWEAHNREGSDEQLFSESFASIQNRASNYSNDLFSYLQHWLQHTELADKEQELIDELEQYSEPEKAFVSHEMHELLALKAQRRILALRRYGYGGVEPINDTMAYIVSQQKINRRMLLPYFKIAAYSGMPVMATRNDYGRGIYNGELGILFALAGRSFVIFSPNKGETEPRFFPANAFTGLRCALATTVHKSQGSEFNRVALVLPPDETSRLLARELIYTAVTRARESLHIFGDWSVFSAGLESTLARDPGLPLW